MCCYCFLLIFFIICNLGSFIYTIIVSFWNNNKDNIDTLGDTNNINNNNIVNTKHNNNKSNDFLPIDFADKKLK